LLLRSAYGTDPALGLQLRAEWSHHGGTWGLLGGARHGDESAVAAALREAGEEASVDPEQVRVEASYLDDHGGWGYTTVVVSALGELALEPRSAETDSVRWVPVGQVDDLTLHPGFASTWPLLRPVGPAPVLVVDAANVVGSRPDGWWHDRVGAVERLRDQLAVLALTGMPAEAVGLHVSGLQVFPVYVLVVEGAARQVPPTAGVEVVSAPASGDDALVDVVRERRTGLRPVAVVTADRELRSRVEAAGAAVLGPRTLLDLI